MEIVEEGHTNTSGMEILSTLKGNIAAAAVQTGVQGTESEKKENEEKRQREETTKHTLGSNRRTIQHLVQRIDEHDK